MTIFLFFLPVPSHPPDNIVCKSYTSTTINVTWDHSFKTNQSEYAEDHYLYYIFIRNIDDGSLWDNEGTPDNSTQIIGLRPGTLYGIRVLVSSTGGMGLASKEIEVRTVAGGTFHILLPDLCFFGQRSFSKGTYESVSLLPPGTRGPLSFT